MTICSDRVILPVLSNSQKKYHPPEYTVLAVLLLNHRRMRKECSWRNGCQSIVDSLNKHWALMRGWLGTRTKSLCASADKLLSVRHPRCSMQSRLVSLKEAKKRPERENYNSTRPRCHHYPQRCSEFMETYL